MFSVSSIGRCLDEGLRLLGLLPLLLAEAAGPDLLPFRLLFSVGGAPNGLASVVEDVLLKHVTEA